MLQNDPPTNTRVRFLKAVEQAKQYDKADLIGPVAKYSVDRPEDLFRVRHRGAVILVRREDIEKF